MMLLMVQSYRVNIKNSFVNLFMIMKFYLVNYKIWFLLFMLHLLYFTYRMFLVMVMCIFMGYEVYSNVFMLFYMFLSMNLVFYHINLTNLMKFYTSYLFMYKLFISWFKELYWFSKFLFIYQFSLALYSIFLIMYIIFISFDLSMFDFLFMDSCSDMSSNGSINGASNMLPPMNSGGVNSTLLHPVLDLPPAQVNQMLLSEQVIQLSNQYSMKEYGMEGNFTPLSMLEPHQVQSIILDPSLDISLHYDPSNLGLVSEPVIGVVDLETMSKFMEDQVLELSDSSYDLTVASSELSEGSFNKFIVDKAISTLKLEQEE